MTFDEAVAEAGIIAILRGVVPDRAVEVGDVLFESGVRVVEVPLNSPDPFVSIAKLANRRGADWVIGAGTVLSIDDVQRTHAAGGQVVLAPNCDPRVIECALRLGMLAIPGIATATDAFTAISAGTKLLKLFPAVTYGPRHLAALGAVLPVGTRVFPVGGIGAVDIASWLQAGAAGFGFGSEVFRTDYTLADIRERARRLVDTLCDARQEKAGR